MPETRTSSPKAAAKTKKRRARTRMSSGRVLFSGKRNHVLYADGGTRGGSPGQSIYWSVGTEDKSLMIRQKDTSGKRRFSDQAELSAFRCSLLLLAQVAKPGDVCTVRMDCQTLVPLLNQRKSPYAKRLRELFRDITKRMHRLNRRGIKVRAEWTPREQVVKVLGH